VLVSIARYRQITGDTTTSDDVVTAALGDAQGMIEDELDRPLESAERTETLPLKGDRVYPRVTPITAAPGFTIIGGYALLGASMDSVGDLPWMPALLASDMPQQSTVTYTGGFTSDSLPTKLARAIARLARHIVLNPQAKASAYPYGAKSVAAGDVSVGFEKGVGTVSDEIPAGILGSIEGYRRPRA
jgi:hypothetical protein